MTSDMWKEVCEAAFPVARVPLLSGVRDRSDIRVRVVGDTAWIRWDSSGGDVIRSLLAAPGVDFFRIQNGKRFRLGSRLPWGTQPVESEERSLSALLVPESNRPAPPDVFIPPSIEIRLVRGGPVQATTALLCPIRALRAWADTATTFELTRTTGLLEGERAILFGSHLPRVPDSTRLSGTHLLLPIGFQLSPTLPPEAVKSIVAASAAESVLFTEAGCEILATHSAEPLTRAGLRVAFTQGSRT